MPLAHRVQKYNGLVQCIVGFDHFYFYIPDFIRNFLHIRMIGQLHKSLEHIRAPGIRFLEGPLQVRQI